MCSNDEIYTVSASPVARRMVIESNEVPVMRSNALSAKLGSCR